MNYLEEAAREVEEHRRKQYALLAKIELFESDPGELNVEELLRKEKLKTQKILSEAKNIADAESAKGKD